MIREDYLDYTTPICLSSQDLVSVNIHISKIEKTSEACAAIAATLAFLNNNPEAAIKTTPHFHGKKAVEQIITNTMGEFTQNRGVIIKGLCSMMEIISDTLSEAQEDIISSIENGAKIPDNTDDTSGNQ